MNRLTGLFRSGAGLKLRMRALTRMGEPRSIIAERRAAESTAPFGTGDDPIRTRKYRDRSGRTDPGGGTGFGHGSWVACRSLTM